MINNWPGLVSREGVALVENLNHPREEQFLGEYVEIDKEEEEEEEQFLGEYVDIDGKVSVNLQSWALAVFFSFMT